MQPPTTVIGQKIDGEDGVVARTAVGFGTFCGDALLAAAAARAFSAAISDGCRQLRVEGSGKEPDSGSSPSSSNHTP